MKSTNSNQISSEEMGEHYVITVILLRSITGMVWYGILS
jgi:hypothetical protein